MTVKRTLVSSDMRAFALCSLMELHRRKGKATVEIKEYGENDEHSHRTYNRSIQFSSNGTIAYFCLIAACAAARRAIGTRKGEQET